MSDVIITRLNQLTIAAERRGCSTRVEFGRPASGPEIAECEQLLGSALPNSLCDFLRHWNGMAVYYYDTPDPVTPGRWRHKLEVVNIALIARGTSAVRKFITGTGATHPLTPEQQHRTEGLLVLSEQDDLVVYQALDQGGLDGSCPIMEFNLEYYPDWLDEPGLPIAASVEEFLVRSLDRMIRDGTHFLYWL